MVCFSKPHMLYQPAVFHFDKGFHGDRSQWGQHLFKEQLGRGRDSEVHAMNFILWETKLTCVRVRGLLETELIIVALLVF